MQMLPFFNMRVEEYHCGDALFYIKNRFYMINARLICFDADYILEGIDLIKNYEKIKI